MNLSVPIFLITLCTAYSKECNVECPEGEEELAQMECGLDLKAKSYTMFPSKCAMAAYSACHNVEFVQTPLKYCIKSHTSSRRMYGESCPVFCPNHYRPVCAASKHRGSRSFVNGCHLDMINCRGDADYDYVELPLEYCQNHAMKNIFKERIIATNLNDYIEY